MQPIANFDLGIRSAAFTHQQVQLFRREPYGAIQVSVKHFMCGSLDADREDSGPLHKVAATLRRIYPDIVNEVDKALAAFNPSARSEVVEDFCWVAA